MSQASAIRPPTHPITAGAHAHLQIVFASRALAFLASARQWPSCVLGDPERGATAAGGLHAVRTGIRGHYHYLLLSLPETIGLEFRRGPGVRVLLDVIQLLRCGRGTQLRHGRGVYRLVLLADVIGNRDGGEYPDDHDDRIVSKPQTEENSGFVRCSRKTAPSKYNWLEPSERRRGADRSARVNYPRHNSWRV